MANKKLWLGMLAVVLIFGLLAAGCGGDNNDTSNGKGNKITITGITGKTGDAVIYVVSSFEDENGMVAAGSGTISGGSVTFNLVKDEKMNPWTGNGSYYLMFGFEQGESTYYYTNGQTITIGSEDEDFYSTLPKYNIASASSSIAFNLFKEITIIPNDNGNEITITGITDKTGDAVIYVVSSFEDESGIVAGGMGTISGGSVTFNLVIDEAMNAWTGTGSYYLMLEFDQDESEYFYTNGQTISVSDEDEDYYSKLSKYEITSASSTIAFNLFKEITFLVDDLPALTGTVAIDNTSPKVGDTLTATYSGGNGTGTETYQWIQGESTNIGTNSNTYTVVAADLGKTIKVQVSFADQSGNKTSTATGIVADVDIIQTKPAAPTGLTKGAVTSSSIAVTWTSISGVSGYTVYAGTTSENMTQKGTSTAASFTITGLTSNTPYYIAVSATNDLGEGSKTTPITATTLLTAPTGFTAGLDSTTNQVYLSWDAVSGAASYKIYWSNSATGDYLNQANVQGTYYNGNANIVAGVDNYYKVSACTSGNVEGELSDYVVGIILKTTKDITQFRFADFSVNGTISGTNISVTVPNIVNLTTLVPTITHNGESISPASGVARDFTSPKQYTVTAEDGTNRYYTVTVTVTDKTLATAFSWINSNFSSGKTYTIVAQANESLAPTTISSGSNIIILSGGTTEKTISLSGTGSLFTIISGTLTLENNITLSGTASNTASLVKIGGVINNNSTLVMKTGSKIQNNTVTVNDGDACGGGVYLSSHGTFTMDGGTISGNKVEATSSSSSYNNTLRAKGGGVYIYSGTFTMNGGTISNNTAHSSKFPSAGGGVYVEYEFKMNGGTISGNTAKTATNSLGGGVYINSTGGYSDTGFFKTGGTIYGSNESSTELQNTAKNTSSGHAVYALIGSTPLIRNNTAGTTINMNSNTIGSAGGCE